MRNTRFSLSLILKFGVAQMPKSTKLGPETLENRSRVDFISAVQAGRIEEVKKFLADGMSPNAQDAMHLLESSDPSFNKRAAMSNRCVGLSALSSAACLGNLEMCTILLDAGANPNIRETRQAMQTPLMVAIHNGQVAVMHLLLERGADCFASDIVANTPLKLCRYLKNPEEAKSALEAALKANREKMTLTQAIIHGDTERLKELLLAGNSPNVFHSDGFSALFYACLVGNLETLDLLLENGAEIDLGSNGTQTPTLVLSSKGEELKKVTASEFFQEKTGRTVYSNRLLFGEAPIFAACELGRMDIVSRMLKAGCDVNCLTEVGKVSPLMMAIYSENLELAQYLIDVGADLQHRDSRGASVLEWASKAAPGSGMRNLIRDALGLKNAAVDFKAEFKKFKDVEASTEFKDALAYLMNVCQNKTAYPWKKKKGVYRLYVNEKAWDNIAQVFGKGSDYIKGAKKEAKQQLKNELADMLQDEIRKRGFLLVSHRDEQGSAMQLLFPSSNKYAVLAACGTNGDNYGRDNSEIIQLLTELEEKQAFVLSECTHDAVGGRFIEKLSSPEALSQFLYSICPDLIDGESVCDEGDLAKQLREQNRFYLWWS